MVYVGGLAAHDRVHPTPLRYLVPFLVVKRTRLLPYA
jgi:hypothetical protein